MEPTPSETMTKRMSWSLIFQVATLIFLAGIAYASFQTKSQAKDDMDYISKTYMPRELSIEKWTTNDKDHAKIDAKLDEILKELRRRK